MAIKMRAVQQLVQQGGFFGMPLGGGVEQQAADARRADRDVGLFGEQAAVNVRKGA